MVTNASTVATVCVSAAKVIENARVRTRWEQDECCMLRRYLLFVVRVSFYKQYN